MKEWFFSDHNDETGPHDLEYAKAFVREHPGAYCWKQGWTDWRLVFEVPEIRRMKKDGITPFPPPPEAMISPKPRSLPSMGQVHEQPSYSHRPHFTIGKPESSPQSQPQTHTQSETQNFSSGYGHHGYTEGLDFKIYGSEMQFVEIELDANESAIAEAGAMMYKTASVEMETIFGDGSQKGGFMSALLGIGKRLLTNESLFVTVFTQTRASKGKVAFAAPFPGTILALNLSDYNGRLICQKDSFLAAAKGVQIGIHFQKKILTGLFGGEGFIMQKLEGNGWVFVHMGGSLHKIQLGSGEVLHVDTGCLAALTSTVDFDIQLAGGVKSILFGGEGVCIARLTGPGTVWVQSLPFSRLAGRMLSAAPQGGGRQQDEGSILGGFGNLLDGDGF
jgi:uncharacterized protein (TIGR00266 family)